MINAINSSYFVQQVPIMNWGAQIHTPLPPTTWESLVGQSKWIRVLTCVEDVWLIPVLWCHAAHIVFWKLQTMSNVNLAIKIEALSKVNQGLIQAILSIAFSFTWYFVSMVTFLMTLLMNKLKSALIITLQVWYILHPKTLTKSHT